MLGLILDFLSVIASSGVLGYCLEMAGWLVLGNSNSSMLGSDLSNLADELNLLL
jgi:hypothetical protein